MNRWLKVGITAGIAATVAFPARAGILDSVIQAAAEYYGVSDEAMTVIEAVDFDQLVSDPDGALEQAVRGGVAYAEAYGSEDLNQVLDYVPVDAILAGENVENAILQNAIAGVSQIAGDTTYSTCPLVNHFAPGQCPLTAEDYEQVLLDSAMGVVFGDAEEPEPMGHVGPGPAPSDDLALNGSGHISGDPIPHEDLSTEVEVMEHIGEPLSIDLTRPPKANEPGGGGVMIVTGPKGAITKAVPTTSGGLRKTSRVTGDSYGDNRSVNRRDLANLYDREESRGIASQYLGDDGRKWLSNATQSIMKLMAHNTMLAAKIKALSLGGQSLDVTQDVMKVHLQNQGHVAELALNQNQILAQILTSQLLQQQQEASHMQVNANVSESLDEMNRSRRIDRSVGYANAARTPIYLPGFKWN